MITHRESSTTFLPLESWNTSFVIGPLGGIRLNVPHHIRESTRGTQAYDQVQMILNSADGFRHEADIAYAAAYERAESTKPSRCDEPCAILCGKDSMAVKQKVGGWHAGLEKS